MALAEIFADEEGIDLCGIASHHDILKVIGKNLRLDKIALAQQLGKAASFPDVVQGIAVKPVRIFVVDPADLAAFEVSTIFISQIKMLGHFLESQALQLAAADIVEL